MLLTTPRIKYSDLKVSKDWNFDSLKESKMHRIHTYPARFPSFIVSRALTYSEEKKITVKNIADIFCGCGTTALEAKKNDLNFIGYDINPVATLIAKVKSESYQIKRLEKYYKKILITYKYKGDLQFKHHENERIKYWFKIPKIKNLDSLLFSIQTNVPKGKYRNFFLCAFSNILKPTSKWLAKSIKPQIDPKKKSINVIYAYKNQIELMIKAVREYEFNGNSKIEIFRKNIINGKIPNNKVEMLLTSPPYVTSYEYADLHQLSSLWLGYTTDYRNLRKGSVGSLYHQKISKLKIFALNETGRKIYERLYKVDKGKAYAVAKYFVDMNKAIEKSYALLKKNGLVFYVIGNTTYKGVKVDNTNYLLSCLIDNKFSDIEVIKRKINSKILTPFRDIKGKFSKYSNNRKVYQYEYILIARKK